MKLTIKNIRARAVMVPLKRPPQSASGSIGDASLVLIDIETGEGITGSSYLFAFQKPMLKPTVQMIEGVGEMLKGDAVAPYEIEAKLRKRFTLLDTFGVLGQVIAGIDMAAWDACAKALNVPLACALGGSVKPIRAYNSCGLWIKDPSLLADEAAQLLSEGNFSALKLRIGRPDFKLDLAAVRNVKKRIGDDVMLMTDFNQSQTVNEAIRRSQILDDEGLYWIEEPIRHDNYDGCAKIAAEVVTPIQIGENLLNTGEMQKAIDAQAAEFYMPDVQRIGGVTGWMRAAAVAQVYNLDMSSHLFPEFSAHLLAVTPTCHWLEYVDWASGILKQPIEIKDGHALIPDRPGAGIEWNEDAVKKYLVA
ncbi:MAG TPA: enolase C-terminal domain-like protein [Burkholderiales bacterium]|jgi:mandelate racemase|nr:enolase C-terminal domain-like protein [Burkholderiales bacterium]